MGYGHGYGVMNVRISRTGSEMMIIGIANGAFDLLHADHLFLLHEASKRCDLLLVALNTDSSIRRLKGEGRPIQTLSERADALCSHGFIVVTFDTEEDFIRIIQRFAAPWAALEVKIFKGTEYRDQKVWGDGMFNVEVEFIQTPLGLHTTTEIEKRRLR